MHQGRVADLLELALHAANLAHRQVREACGLALRAFALQHGGHNLEQVTFALAHRNPVRCNVDSHDSSLNGSRRTFLSR
jgi:hypothetical protein